MKSNIIKVLASAAMVFGVVTSLHAIPITGYINIGTKSGGNNWVGNVNNVNTITTIVSFGDAVITSATLALANAGPNGSTITMGEPLDFATPTINNPLWQSVNGWSFTLSPPIGVTRTGDTLRLSGVGVIKAPVESGYDDTVGEWTWSGELNGTSFFTFSSTTTPGVSVPDGGMTVALLGAALSGLALLRRKLA
jgi:VPDSG-CTERM motif